MADLPPFVPPQPGQQQGYGFTNDPQQMNMGAPAPQQSQEGNGLAVASMVLGIISIVLCWVPIVDQIVALLGIIFGAVGIGKANKIGGKGKGFAVAGLVCAILGMLFGIAIIVMAMQARSHYSSYSRYGSY